MNEIIVYGRRKEVSEYTFHLFIGTIFLALLIACLFGFISITSIFYFLIPMVMFYGYAFSKLSLKEERLLINDRYLSYHRGVTRKLFIPLDEIKSMDFDECYIGGGFSVHESLFIIYLNDNRSISAPYALFEIYQLQKFGKEAMIFIQSHRS